MICLAGHIDHGKSALVHALTGGVVDRLPEEKRRGMTIDLGFSHFDAGGLRFALIDVPGHERFIHTMVAGASGVDVALLVVAADDSVMPQTREHLAFLELLGVRRGVIAITKCDLADDEQLELVELEIAELVEPTFLAGSAPDQGFDATQDSASPNSGRHWSRRRGDCQPATDGRSAVPTADRPCVFAGRTGSRRHGHCLAGNRARWGHAASAA